MPRYQVYVETSAPSVGGRRIPRARARVVGCVARGKPKREEIDKVRDAIEAYLAQ